MSEALQAVKEADAVSIELVGTLLVPAVCRPVDVFRLAQELFNDRSGHYLTDELAPHRVAAEEAARLDAELDGRSPDSVTLAAVYERVGESMALDGSITALLMDAEVEAAGRTLRGDPAMVELVRLAGDEGKPVVGVADTCLPAPVLAGVLAAEGVPPLAEMAVSSESGRSVTEDATWGELTGRLPTRRLVHVGADPAVASAAGRNGVTVTHVTGPLEAFRLQLGATAALDGPRVFRHLEIDGFRLINLHRSMVNALVAGTLAADQGRSAAFAVGYGALGPCVTAFVQWLQRSAERAGCDSLLFEGPGGALVADAYRHWWGGSALPLRDDDGADGRTGSPALVASGWNAGSGRWDGGPEDVATAGTHPAVRLCAALDPSSTVEEGAPPTEAFVDGRRDAQTALFRDLFGTGRGLLEACLAGADRPASAEGPVAEVRKAALEFVVDFSALTEGLPTTVAIIDRRTACENLVMVLNFPTPAATQVLDRITPGPA